MVDRKAQAVTFGIGSALMAGGLTPISASEILLTVGTSLASLAYSLVFLSWRREASPARVSLAPQALAPIVTAPVPAAPPPQEAAAPPITTQSPIGTQVSETMAPPVASQPAPSVRETSVTPPPPPPPPQYERAKPPRKLPSLKAPEITAPKWIVEHRVPISLIVLGLPLLIAGLMLAGLSPSVALGYGLLIPGVLLLGIGGLVLFLQLYRRPIGLRRFCMHCGFQMMTTDISCGRCRRSPPSGVDTKVCPNCGAVIPTLAKFCRDCGAGQPAT